MIVDVLGGPIRVECIGSALACSAAPLEASLVLTLMLRAAWVIAGICIIAAVYAAARIAYSRASCNSHERESKILVGALVGAIVACSTDTTILLLSGGG